MDSVRLNGTVAGMENRIAELRKARGWSMRDLAQRTNSSASTINSLEKGKSELTLSWLKRLSKAFNVGVEEILGLPTPSLPSFSHPSSHRENEVTLWQDVRPLEKNAFSEFSIFNLGENQKIFIVTSTALNQLVPFGSFIIVEMKKDAKDDLASGGIVIGKYCEVENNPMLIRQFVPPNLLITNSYDSNLPSINLASEAFQIEGIVLWAATRLSPLTRPNAT